MLPGVSVSCLMAWQQLATEIIQRFTHTPKTDVDTLSQTIQPPHLATAGRVDSHTKRNVPGHKGKTSTSCRCLDLLGPKFGNN